MPGKRDTVTNPFRKYIPTGLERVPSERERRETDMREKDRIQRETHDRVERSQRDTNSHGKRKDR
jgi:hypothetical protein